MINEKLIKKIEKIIFKVENKNDLDFVIENFKFNLLKEINLPYLFYTDTVHGNVVLSGTTKENLIKLEKDNYFKKRNYKILNINDLKNIIKENV